MHRLAERRMRRSVGSRMRDPENTVPSAAYARRQEGAAGWPRQAFDTRILGVILEEFDSPTFRHTWTERLGSKCHHHALQAHGRHA
jgi:hypothetical protein